MTRLRHESESTLRLPSIELNGPKTPMDTRKLHRGLRALAQLQQRRNKLGEIQNISAKMQAIAIDLLHQP